jgi:hypothetical protein
MRYGLVLGVMLGLCAGCSSGSSSSTSLTPGPAHVYKLAGFRPTGPAPLQRPTTVAFTIEQPSGSPLTEYRSGAGPHTGVHLIIVRDDLSTIIHRHPEVRAGGRFVQRIMFPAAGRYRVIIDAYPLHRTPVPNFQLFQDIQIRGTAKRQPLGTYRTVQHVDGFTITAPPQPRLRAIQPTLMTVHVTDAAGKPAPFVPWYGALAHAIFFQVGTLDYVHTHICAPGASACSSLLDRARIAGKSAAPGKLTIGMFLPSAGRWKLFLQAKPEGRLVTASFVLSVRP